jgi:translation initiation factor 2 beta subunit (eIF-2beta)/eIF-5
MRMKCHLCGRYNDIPESEFAQTDIVFEKCRHCGNIVSFVWNSRAYRASWKKFLKSPKEPKIPRF